MRYLDWDRLEAEDADAFQATAPYPWINPAGYLHEEGYRALLDSLPDPKDMDERFGETRKFGQQSHDRLALDYYPDAPISSAWREFVAELEGPRYRQFLCRMLRVSTYDVAYHWHYTPPAASVSPHCDAKRKLASHIFYFNDEADWDPAWGGETMILDDAGRFSRRSAPSFDAFAGATRSNGMGNRSLLFARTPRAWHGVEPLRCPEGRYRRVFIVVANRVSRWERLVGRPR